MSTAQKSAAHGKQRADRATYASGRSMTKFAMDTSVVAGAADKLDAIAGDLRGLRLPSPMSVLGVAIPNTPNVTSPIKAASDGADTTVTNAISNCAGQVEAFGALVRVASTTTRDSDEFNATRFDDAGRLPSVAPWNPGNSPTPTGPR